MDANEIIFNCPEFCESKSINYKYDIWLVRNLNKAIDLISKHGRISFIYIQRCAGFIVYSMCTLEDSVENLKQIKDFKTWIQPNLPNDLSEELRYLFRRLTLDFCLTKKSRS